MNTENLTAALAGVAEVATDPDLRRACAVDDQVPAAVVAPPDEAGVAHVLKAAQGLGLAVAPRGGGTKVGLGHPPRRLDLVLATERLDQVVAYEPADLTVTVQAGLRMGPLQALLGRYGQTLPLDSPGGGAATVGGLIATAPTGPRRLAYGGVRDQVVGLRVALPDGRLIRTGGRVVKNVAGYDMTKLFIGALGTLGIITEATFKVRPRPESVRNVAAGFASPGACLACAEAILASELVPAALTAFSPGAAERLGLPGPWALAVLLEESGPNVRYQAERVVEEARRCRALDLNTNVADPHLWERVADYAAFAGAAAAVRVNTVISALEQELTRRPAGEAIAHVGTGQVLRMAFGEAEDPALADAIRAWLRPPEGTAVLERAPGLLRAALPVWGDPGPAFPLLQGLKQAYDPAGVLNPGRYVGGL